MRILHLDAGKEMRGGQWQVLRLIEGLAAEGVESTLLARAGAPLYTAARALCWRVEPIGLTRAVRMAHQHDLMHAHDAHGHTLAAVVRGTPLVVSRRVAFPIGSKWKYGRANRYLAVSQFVKGVLMQGGVPEEKISLVYDGVPLLEEARGNNVVSPATADALKGAPLAVEAAKLAGVELHLSTDLEHDLREAGIFVYITHSEGLGSGVLLAMSAGVPVVASRVGGLPEVIRHRENGLLVENTAEAVADAIGQLLRDPERARQYGHAARQSVMDHFTIAGMVRHTIEVYHQVLN
ncbi:Glycosyl transferase, group 1 [Candidatus Sulfopaludibacter sp. SbA3]|nr:Glycosyl transferase, group 1 [Candidatus Sulfopaludibacter sp. SbA3]